MNVAIGDETNDSVFASAHQGLRVLSVKPWGRMAVRRGRPLRFSGLHPTSSRVKRPFRGSHPFGPGLRLAVLVRICKLPCFKVRIQREADRGVGNCLERGILTHRNSREKGRLQASRQHWLQKQSLRG